MCVCGGGVAKANEEKHFVFDENISNVENDYCSVKGFESLRDSFLRSPFIMKIRILKNLETLGKGKG